LQPASTEPEPASANPLPSNYDQALQQAQSGAESIDEASEPVDEAPTEIVVDEPITSLTGERPAPQVVADPEPAEEPAAEPEREPEATQANPEPEPAPVSLPQVSSGQPAAEQARLYLEAAKLARQGGNVEQALQAYQRAFEAQPTLDATADYALLLAEQSRGAQLTELLQAAHGKLTDIEHEQLLDRLGRFYLERQDYAGGAQLMQGLIAAEPRIAMPYNQLAMILAAQRENEAALATVKRGLNDAGDNYLGRYLEAYLTLSVSGPTAALPLAQAVSLHPRVERNGYMLYLRLLETTGNYVEEAEVAAEAYEKYPGHPGLLGYLAQSLYFADDPQGAIDMLEDPANAQVKYPARDEVLGTSYLDLGNYVKAAGHLTAALQAKPDSPELLAALGQAQYFMGDIPAARNSLGRALNVAPELPAAHLWQGWALAQAGELERAEQAFARVDKNPLATKEELAWLALGRASAALARGDSAAADVFLDQALAFEMRSEGFFAKLDELRAR
jgi:tetratricopeptide (TPR) repeat protein